MIDGLAMGCMYGVTIGCHTIAPSVYTNTTDCKTDRYNSSVVYTLHAIGVTTGRNTGVNTDQSAYRQLNVSLT